MKRTSTKGRSAAIVDFKFDTSEYKLIRMATRVEAQTGKKIQYPAPVKKSLQSA